MTLNDLDGDGDPTDRTHVTIDYRYATNDYLIISEGTYGVAKRKIEAIIKGVAANSVGVGGGGHPIYYTPSAVSIEVDETDPARVKGITLDDISMFSEKDILIESIATPEEFVSELGTGGDQQLKRNGNNAEELGTWNSMDARYFDDPKPYNTTPRRTTEVRNNGNVVTTDYDTPGFAAQWKICELVATDTTPGACDPISRSIADGVSSYDSTTGTHATDGTPNVSLTNPPRPVAPAQAQKCTFMSKPFPRADQCYITYPFPRPEPPARRLQGAAQEQNTPTNRQYWDVATDGMPGPNDWDALLQCNVASCLNRLVFVDAGAANAPLDYHLPSSRRAEGVMVVWCGDLQLNQTFKGVIFNLYGDGSAFGASNCAEDSPDLTIDRGPETNGVIRNNGVFCQCWLYAQGGGDTRAGIEIAPDSTIKFLPGVDWNFKEFLDEVLNDDPPTQFDVRSWRELYE